MRFRISAKVEAHGVTREAFELIVGDLRVGITTGDKSAVTGIWVELPVAGYDKWMPSLIPGDGTAVNPHQIAFNEPPAADRLLIILQYLESLGSFWLGIHRINWVDAKREWVAESQDEKARIPVFSVSRRLAYERRPIPFNPTILRQLLEAEGSKRWLDSNVVLAGRPERLRGASIRQRVLQLLFFPGGSVWPWQDKEPASS